MHALSRTCCLFALICVAACAEGYEGLSSLRLNQTIPSASGSNASRAGAGAGNAGAAGMTAPPTSAGTECKMGATEPCMCTSNGADGVHQCKADGRSKMGGYFATECTQCATPVMPNPGDVTTDGGTAGSAGSAGSSASGGSGGAAGSSGSGGSGGGGSAGTSAAGRPGSCTPACTNSCFPVGILACCRPVGGCGCTWAPGAYCF